MGALDDRFGKGAESGLRKNYTPPGGVFKLTSETYEISHDRGTGMGIVLTWWDGDTKAAHCMIFWYDDRTIDVANMLVEPAYRGQGIFTYMFHEGVDEYWARYDTRIATASMDENQVPTASTGNKFETNKNRQPMKNDRVRWDNT
jgi:GNAT superfamily N-acetyltransferase